MTARKQRRSTKHRGVKLLQRTLKSGSTIHLARWTDPDTGKSREVSLDKLGLTNQDGRRAWAVRKAVELDERKREIALGIPKEPEPEPEPDRTTIDAALARYLEGASVRLRERTVQTYRLAFSRLERWADEEGVKYTDQLTAERLESLRDALLLAPKRRAAPGGSRGAQRTTGKARSPVSINRELRTLGTLLTEWRRRGLVPLTGDEIGDAMRRLPVERDLPTYLTPADLKRLFAAAARHDAETWAETREEHAGRRPVGTTPKWVAIAPFTAFVLLTGMRRGEALSVRWTDVDLDALDAAGTKVGEIRLRAENVKTRSARAVGLEVSPALRRILSTMRLRGRGQGLVFPELTADLVDDARHRIADTYGGPSFTWQELRSTCATYLVNAPGIYGAASAFLAARQLGHSVVVAERRYAGQLRGIPRDARTLDAAMQIEEELAAVLPAGAAPLREVSGG